MKYSMEDIIKLEDGYQKVHFSYVEKLPKYSQISCNAAAKEFLQHGFCRRLKSLKICIDNIYDIHPPERLELLEDEEIEKITINIQAFIFNLYGCIDNLCWVLLKEKQIDHSLSDVNFYKEKVWRILPNNFKNYLNANFKDWYNQYCKNFRHSLAHRIPLYVPEGVRSESSERYKKIPIERMDAILKRDYDRADELDEEEKSLMMNLPIYTHSFTENSPQVPYHSQLLADFNTIIELADKFFEEFERNSFLNYIEEKPSFSKKIILNILSRIEKKTRKHIKKLTRQRVG